jgi:hypothetical protein
MPSLGALAPVRSVTAIADNLGLEFALFHRKQDGKALDAPENPGVLQQISEDGR